MKKVELRFNNVLGDDYDLSAVSYPHHDAFQKATGDVLGKFLKDNKAKIIKVLEIGSGTGLTTRVILDVDKRIMVTTIDNEPKMFIHLTNKVNEWNMVNRVNILQSDVIEYLANAKPGSFDAVISVFTIHNLDRIIRPGLILNIYKVLKPGGIFINGDKYAHDDLKLHQAAYNRQKARYNFYDDINRSDIKKAMVDHQERDEKQDLIFYEGEAKKLFKKAGFKNINTNWRVDMEAVISGVK